MSRSWQLPRAVPLLLLAALIPGKTVAASIPDYVRHALAQFTGDAPKGWAYTLTTHNGKETTVERYDPSQPPGRQWMLRGRNGRAPTAAELEQYAKFKARSAPAVARASFDKSDIDIGAVQLLHEDANRAEFDGRFRNDNGDKMLAHLGLRLTVTKQPAAVESFRLRLLAPFSPILGVKIQKLEVELTNSPPAADRPALPLHSHAQFQGRLFFIKTIEETEEISYSDYLQTTSSPPPSK